jgi:hypothetical protein
MADDLHTLMQLDTLQWKTTDAATNQVLSEKL